MSAVEQAVVLVGALWLAVLTIVLMLVVRQTSLLTVSLGITEGRFSNVLDNDGPEVGFDIKPLLSRLDGTGGMSSDGARGLDSASYVSHMSTMS